MAIDTAAKRFRIMDFDTPASAPGIPTPSGVVDASERAASLWLYFAAAITVLGVDVILHGTVFQRFTLPAGP